MSAEESALSYLPKGPEKQLGQGQNGYAEQQDAPAAQQLPKAVVSDMDK